MESRECTFSSKRKREREKERSQKALEKLKMPKWAMNPNWSQDTKTIRQMA